MDGALQLVDRMHPRRPRDRTMILAHVHPGAARDDFAPAPELARANYLDAVVAIYIDAVEPAASEQPPDRGQMGEQRAVVRHDRKGLGHEKGGVERTLREAKAFDRAAVEANRRGAGRLAPRRDHRGRAVDAGDRN